MLILFFRKCKFFCKLKQPKYKYPMLKKVILTGLFGLLIGAGGFSQVHTNVGTEFWIAFPPNQSSSASLRIFISSEYSTSGMVTSAFPGVDQSFTVVPGIVTELIVTVGVALFGGVENKGIHITSILPVSVYGLNWLTATTDAYMALPVESLGTDYRIMGYPTTMNTHGSAMSVVATQNATALVVYNHAANSTTNVNLEQGETYYVEAAAIGEDMTGSRIQSNFPVSVFSSMRATNIPATCFFADHIIEQMWPVTSWGKNFAVVPLAGRDGSGDIIRVLAAEDGTIVSINGTVVATLNTGDLYEDNLSGLNAISTSKASCVAQFAKGIWCSGNITGDPLMMLIPPREQFLTDYTIGTPAGFTSNWVNLVAPDYALNTIYEDGILIPAGVFTQIAGTNYYGAQRSITEGSHTFTSTVPFGVFVYGWTFANSYGYPGGGSLSPVATVNSVSLSPTTASGILNITTVCLMATVLDGNANPLEGVLVNFNFSGLGPLTGNAYTNNLGIAQYCYTRTGSTPGIDNVYAEVFGFSSATSTVTWSNLPCENPTDGGVIGGDQSGCSGFVPLPVANVTLPTGETGILEYRWQESVISAVAGFTDIPGSNAVTWNPGVLLQTTWYRRLARVDCMADWSGAVASNVVQIAVNPLVTPAVSIVASANSVCQGSQVNFTATPINPGSAPAYQWKINAVNAINGNNTVFSYIPLDGDIVTCELTSNAICATGNPVNSNAIIMAMIENLPVGITILASGNPVCPGSSVTYTASPVNGGSNPSYQWKVNGNNAINGNNAVFIYSPVNGDQISCMLTSSLSCVTGNPAGSAAIIMSVSITPNLVFTPCFDTITRINAKPFKLKGGQPLGGSYSGPGVNSATGIFSPSMAGTGVKTITYSYVNVYDCSATKSTSIVVQPNPAFTCGNPFTDPRDNRIYPSIQLGTQCWMASNLDFGIGISDLTPQTDNCIPEKYTGPASQVPRPAFYQWDELMGYEDTPTGQGLCPPGWHVPSESDWTSLFNFYQGNSVAGGPLKDTQIDGFKAIMSGVFYSQNSMNHAGFATIFWSSTESGASRVMAHGLNERNFSVSLYPALRANAFPVRCLKD